MKISIIGAGIVGRATGIGLHKYGHKIVFYDIDREKVARCRKEGYEASEKLNVINGCDVHMLCLPTPTVNGKFDATTLESAGSELAKVMNKQNKYQVIVVRSTILPCTTRQRIIPLLQSISPLRLGEDYGVCCNPEFLREAHALDDFLNSPIIVIGEYDKRSGDILEELYVPIKSPIVRTTLENAEAIKYFSNVYNSMKVSFFNELYMIAKRLGLDHQVISKSLIKASLGVRIPEYYTEGGYPFGGKCLPKDLAAFISFLEEKRINPKLFRAVMDINEEIKRLTD